MLSGLLKNDIAVQVTIKIMYAFVEMSKFINTNWRKYKTKEWYKIWKIKLGVDGAT